MRRKCIGLILFMLILTTFSYTTLAQQTLPFELQASSAVLLDYESGQILFSQNGKDEHVPASLVKIMTMYVAMDEIKGGRMSAQDTTRVSERAWRMTGSKMFLEPGEVVTIDQLLSGIAVVSGNDACVALAEAISGSEDVFVGRMNDKARQLGLNLSFVDVHGLSPDNKITAEDIAILVYYYLKDHPGVIDYHKQQSFSYQPRSSSNPIVQSNRNGLLRSFEGADGLKTGHLQVAGFNLVGTAVQNNRRMIGVVLGASSESRREQEMTTLLNYGYRNFDLVNISRLLQDKTTKVFKGRQTEVGLAVATPIISVPKGNEKSVSVGIQTKEVEAPVQAGSQVGVLSIYVEGELNKEVPLLAAQDVARGSWYQVLWQSIKRFFQDLIRTK
ncbi:MAG: D-alanyl-D-alanine carboxypeptidase [Firmicutes bacterium]|nr:D-alanyl-D-alanine carboxypeptidase [Bacillota bacterium]